MKISVVYKHSLSNPLNKKVMAKYSKGAGDKVEKAMHEMHQGKLKSGRSGKKVTSRKQAVAIGLSEARERGEKVPRKAASKSTRGGRTKAASKKTASKKTASRGSRTSASRTSSAGRKTASGGRSRTTGRSTKSAGGRRTASKSASRKGTSSRSKSSRSTART
jgi:hypothetical protein